jgi:hypothetical protein
MVAGENGFQTKQRFCVNPEPTNGGSDCSDTNIDAMTQSCNEDPCAIGNVHFITFFD